MSKRAVIPKERPKKPLNFYFQFRLERTKALQGEENRDKLLKEEWANITAEVKEAEKVKYKKELEKFNVVLAEWQKAHPEEAKKGKEVSKGRKKKEDMDDDEEEEKPKPDKTKGAPKAGRGRGKKEEEEEVKPEKAKSKGKGKKEEKVEVDPKSKKAKK